MTGPVLWISLAVIAGLALLGGRLLVLAGRSGELPELILGLFFLMVGPLGYLPLFLLSVFPDLRPDQVLLARATAHTGITLAVALMAVFTWRVFRPDAAWATAFTLLLMAGLFAGYADSALAWDFQPSEPGSRGWLLRIGVRGVVMAWTAWEPLRYWRLSRRRLTLGLADPLVTNRLLLWTLWAASILAIHLLGVANAWLDLGPARDSARALLGVGCGLTIWLTFFPPAGYRRAILTRWPEPTPEPTAD